ncbi:MAG TPA: EVE domain-containing protein [Planctomycetes bacterium]|nr:EVE domain-containing protein [Planctomycetota bacterium]HIK60308.1 EVE domain-containing protein [Planctomycetota bacterium]
MARKRRYWLLKSEPGAFSFEDLLASPKKTTLWDGVRNYQARNMLRDDLQPGDGVLFYHSNAKPPGVAGVAEVVRAGYPDPTQFDPADGHFDPKSDPETPRWFVVDVRACGAFAELLPLETLKGASKLKDMALLQRGQRLSVQPVSSAEWREVLCLGGRRDLV